MSGNAMPGRVSLLVSGIAKIVLGAFCLFTILSDLKYLSDFMITISFLVYGNEIFTGILGVCFHNSDSLPKTITMLVFEAIQVVYFLFSAKGGGLNRNFFMVLLLCLNLWLLVGGVLNLVATLKTRGE